MTIKKRRKTMSDYTSNECYKFYMALKENQVTNEELEKFLEEKQICKEIWLNKKSRIEFIENCMCGIKTFGIELEYAGRNTYCNESHELTETVKYDGSVAGDGREWNLKPRRFCDVQSDSYMKALERWMLAAVAHNCEMHVSAGNHIHFGADDMIEDEDYQDDYYDEQHYDSDTMYLIGQAVRGVFNKIYGGPIYDTEENTILWVDKIKALKDASDKEPAVKKCMEAIRFLYSVSNRHGTEEYGLGNDGTRGYTRHGTVEIRAFKTTTDYRSIIARTIISEFFLKWCTKTRFAVEGYIDWDEVPSIWEWMNEAHYIVIKNMYTYLAFHCHNKHAVGHTKEELLEKLQVSKQYAAAITRRSLMIAKSLLNNSPEKRAKELFKF
jgi:hypothetical protein